MANTVLITGAYGFIGRNAARYFAKSGWVVNGIGHGTWTKEQWRQWGISDWHTTDITADALLTYGGSPDIIIHCAGSGSVGFSMAHPYQDFQRTVETTIVTLEFMRLHAPKACMVYPSSVAVYGVVEKMPIDESAPLIPVSPYGVHKKISEAICHTYAHHFGIPITIIRLFSVYGTGLRKQLLWDACMKIQQGKNIFSGSGMETRDWLHISDAVSLLFESGSHSSAECPIINGGSGQGVSVRELLSELFTCFGRNDKPQFSGVSRSGDPMNYIANINKLHSWSWQPKISLHEGVCEYVEWFKKGAL